MRKTTLIRAFLAVAACAQAQSADSVLHKGFETETDSILYEMSVEEGAEDIYRVEDAEHYNDHDGAIVDYYCSPEFPGGLDSLNSYIQHNLHWPPTAPCSNGTVLVEFIVETDGTISNPKVKVSLGPDFDQEAVRLVLAMPKWTWPHPEECYEGIVRRCWYQIPVTFKM